MDAIEDGISAPAAAGSRVKHARLLRGLTQQELADAAGVSRKFVAEFEAGHDRAEIGKAFALMHAAGLSIHAEEKTSPLQPIINDAAEAISAEVKKGQLEFALRLLAKVVTEVVAHGSDTGVLREPKALPSKEWECLFKASMSYGIRRAGATPPRWTKTAPLAEEWFPANPATDRYRSLTKRQTPAELASANIFLREKSLTSV